MADWVRNYRVRDNATGDESDNYEGPPSARLFDVAMTPAELDTALRTCSGSDQNDSVEVRGGPPERSALEDGNPRAMRPGPP